MRYAIYGLVIMLVILHQDYWQWDDASLAFGFLPWTLAYHAGLSMLAAVVWWLVTQFCWHKELEVDAAEEHSA